jgi:hypothetical protein
VDTNKPLPPLPTYREGEKAVPVEIVGLGDAEAVKDAEDVVVGWGDKRKRVEVVWGLGVNGDAVGREVVC